MLQGSFAIQSSNNPASVNMVIQMIVVVPGFSPFQLIRCSRVLYIVKCWDLLKMLGKSRTYPPKWWFDGDLPWYKVENHLAFGPVACKHFGFNLRILLASRSVEHTLKHKEDSNSKVDGTVPTYGCFLKWWYPQNTPK